MRQVYLCPHCGQSAWLKENVSSEEVVRCLNCGNAFSVKDAGQPIPVPGAGPELEFVPVRPDQQQAVPPLVAWESAEVDAGVTGEELRETEDQGSPGVSAVPEGRQFEWMHGAILGEGVPTEREELLGKAKENMHEESGASLRFQILGMEPSGETSDLGLLRGRTQPARDSEETVTLSSVPSAVSSEIVVESAQEPVSGDSESQGEPVGSGILAGENVAPPPTLELICPHCQQSFSMAEARWAVNGDIVGPEAVQALQQFLNEQRLREGLPAGEAGWGIGAPPLQFAVAEGEEGARPFARRPRPQVNVLKEIVGIVGGGILGLLIAYYALVLIRGDHGNFLKLPLPGIPSTYKYSPSWFPSFLKPAAPAESPAENDSAPAEETG